jgi:hypothetical protein
MVERGDVTGPTVTLYSKLMFAMCMVGFPERAYVDASLSVMHVLVVGLCVRYERPLMSCM